MAAYYNENDPKAAAWLRALILGGEIAHGVVDERSIEDVFPNDLRGFTQCHFFAGIGGWSLALRNAGWPDDRPVWTGSCPCQPFSAAGARRGFADERHLWPAWFHLIGVRRPAILFGEQVASASEWLKLVRGDLAALEYAVGCVPIEAASAGADHLRDRYFWGAVALGDGYGAGPQGRLVLPEGPNQRAVGTAGMAHAASERRGKTRADSKRPALGATERGDVGDGAGPRSGPGFCESRPQLNGDGIAGASGYEWVTGADGKARRVKSGVRLLVDGFPCRVGLLRGFGNAIDPRPAQAFIEAFAGATGA